jgi:hypothetical protein
MRGLFWTLGFVLAYGLIPAAVTKAQAPDTTSNASASALALTPPVLFKMRDKRSERLRSSWFCSRGEPLASTGAQTALCFGLTLQPRWSLPATAVRSEPSTRARTTQRAPALPKSKDFGVGKRIALKSGRELSLQLTPTPAHCAPLLQLTY